MVGNECANATPVEPPSDTTTGHSMKHNETHPGTQSVSQSGGSLGAGLRLAASLGACPQVESERRRVRVRRTITTSVLPLQAVCGARPLLRPAKPLWPGSGKPFQLSTDRGTLPSSSRPVAGFKRGIGGSARTSRAGGPRRHRVLPACGRPSPTQSRALSPAPPWLNVVRPECERLPRLGCGALLPVASGAAVGFQPVAS